MTVGPLLPASHLPGRPHHNSLKNDKPIGMAVGSQDRFEKRKIYKQSGHEEFM